MNITELTAVLVRISDYIHIKKLDIKFQKKLLVFDLQYATHQDLSRERHLADSAKIKLAESYMYMSALQYQLEVLVEEQKNIKKSLARLAA